MHDFTIILSRNGSIIHKDRNEAISTKRILAYLSYTIELEKGFTVRDYFKIVNKYKLLQVLNNFYPAYIKEFRKCPKTNCKGRDVKAIAIQKVCSTDFGKTYTYIDVNALRKKPDEHGGTQYAIDFMRLDKMLDLPLTFEPILICSISKKGKDDFRHTFPTFYSLWDVVDGLINELSFYGIPFERDNMKKEIISRMEEVRKGTAKLIPYNVVLKNVKEKPKSIKSVAQSKGK